MRVLYLADAAPGPGGLLASTFLTEEVLNLRDVGVEAHLLSPHISTPTRVSGVQVWPFEPRPSLKERYRTARFLAKNRSPIRSIPWILRPHHLLHVARIEAAAARLVDTASIDLIHSYFGFPGGLGGTLAKTATGRPLVTSFRGMDLNLNPEIGYGQRLDPFFDAAVRALIQNADATLYVSAFMKGWGLRLGANKETAFHVRQAVDLTQFAPSPDRVGRRTDLGFEDPMILTVCGLQHLKGIDTVLRALATIKEDYPFQFVICGIGEERESLESLIRALGLQDRVHFKGWVDRQRVNEYFAACDLFVLGSRNDAAPNVILEALASGRPVVCTDADGMPEHMKDGETGFVVPVDDHEAMADRIRTLLHNPDELERMGQAGRDFTVTEFPWSKKRETLTGIYSQVLSAPGSQRPTAPINGQRVDSPPPEAPAPVHDIIGRKEMDESLVRSLGWTGAVKWVSQLLSWTGTLVVARFLFPEDYGLIGMALVYLGIVKLLSEFGLGVTVVTLRDLSHLEIRQLNSVAVTMGGVGFFASLLAAHPIAMFFEEPRLKLIVQILSLGFLLTSLGIVPRGLLERDLKFKALALVEGSQAIFLTVLLIVLAWAGWGYWTLVVGNLLAPFVATLAVVVLRPTGYSLPHLREMRESLTFTRHQVTGNLSWYVYSNADFLVAGKVLGATPLGLYSLAWTLAQSVPEKIIGLVMRVTPAYFSAVQNDLVELRRYFLLLTEVLAMVAFPALIGLALVAEPLVGTVLEEKWVGMEIPLQILSVYAAYSSVTQLLSRILTVRRETRFLMRIGIFLAVTMPFAFWFGSRWGPTGIALAWLTIHPLSRIPMLLRISKVAGVRIREYLAAYVPALVCTAVMGVAVYGVGQLLVGGIPKVQLLLMIATGMVVYTGTALLLYGRRIIPLMRMLRAGVRGSTGGGLP